MTRHVKQITTRESYKSNKGERVHILQNNLIKLEWGTATSASLNLSEVKKNII